MHPYTAEKLYSLGLKHFENQEYLHALKYFNEALQRDENYAMAYLKRAQVNLIKDDYEAAFYDLNRFIELNNGQVSEETLDFKIHIESLLNN